jgi:hypothetical protein
VAGFSKRAGRIATGLFVAKSMVSGKLPSFEDAVFFRFSDGLAMLAATSFGGFLVVAVPLHIAGQAFALTEPLEAFEHLLNRFVSSGPDLYHDISLNSMIPEPIASAVDVINRAHRGRRGAGRQLYTTIRFMPAGFRILPRGPL